MNPSQRPCRLIQEDMACGRVLSPEDQKHVLSCRACSQVAGQFEKLDSLVHSVMEFEVPEGLADGVVSRIEAEESERDERHSPRFPMAERIFFSRAIQWVLAGIGSVIGLYRIFRFFSGVMFHASM